MANNLTYAVTVNSDGNISYPENFISANNIAQFGSKELIEKCRNDVNNILSVED